MTHLQLLACQQNIIDVNWHGSFCRRTLNNTANLKVAPKIKEQCVMSFVCHFNHLAKIEVELVALQLTEVCLDLDHITATVTRGNL